MCCQNWILSVVTVLMALKTMTVLMASMSHLQMVKMVVMIHHSVYPRGLTFSSCLFLFPHDPFTSDSLTTKLASVISKEWIDTLIF